MGKEKSRQRELAAIASSLSGSIRAQNTPRTPLSIVTLRR
jgi:hypothetical protein